MIKRKFGIVTIALLKLITERGKLLINEILANPRKTLGQSLRAIADAKDFDQHYEALENLKDSNVRMIISRLKSRGLIARYGKHYIPTKTGEWVINKLKSKEKLAWDKKWRVVFFDIPESRRGDRKWLVANLLSEGFRSLQKSVFLGKNPLDQDLAETLVRKNLYRFVRIITIGEIDDDNILEI